MDSPRGRVYRRPIMVLLVPLAFAGNAALALGVLFVAGGAFRHLLTWELVGAGALAVACAWRPRVVWFDDLTRTVTVTWGRRWPFQLAQYRGGWRDLTIARRRRSY